MKRIISLLLCSALVLLALAGCASQAPSQVREPETKDPVTIHLFHQKQEAQETFAKIIEEFNKEYPYITVEQEIVTNDPAAILKARNR